MTTLRPERVYQDFNEADIPLLLFFFTFSRAAPMAYGGSQARNLIIIRDVAASLCQSHSSAGSKPTPQLTATPDP